MCQPFVRGLAWISPKLGWFRPIIAQKSALCGRPGTDFWKIWGFWWKCCTKGCTGGASPLRGTGSWRSYSYILGFRHLYSKTMAYSIPIGRCSGGWLSTTLVCYYFPILFCFLYFSVTIISHRAAAPIKNLYGIPKNIPLRLLEWCLWLQWYISFE